MITNDKTFESAMRELNSYQASIEAANLKLSDPLADTKIAPSTQNTSDMLAHISRGTVITGDLNSDKSIFVEGRVDGNIAADSDVGINGLVNGNIRARNIHFQHAGVKGNSTAAQNATLERTAVIVGDLNGDTLTIDGKIKGKVNATDKLVLEKNALVSGEIVAGGITINDGARISASITITNSAVIDDSNFEF